MGDEGTSLIIAARKEASDLMNKGVLLWKTDKLNEAVEWMRAARKAAQQLAHPVQFRANHRVVPAAAGLPGGLGGGSHGSVVVCR
jgi:hypothetical protein